MLNISSENEEPKWVNYSKDERYLINWISPDKYKKFADKKGNIINVSGLIDYMVIDWEGIYETKDGKDKKLICNLEMKMLLFSEFPKRFRFVKGKAENYNTFFEMDDFEKNS